MTEIQVYQTTNGNWRGTVDGVVHPLLAGSTLPALTITAAKLFPAGAQITLARNRVRLAATPQADADVSANAVQALKSERDAALDVAAELLAVVDDFMPNVGRCTLQNYQRLNEAPFKARRLLKAAGRN